MGKFGRNWLNRFCSDATMMNGRDGKDSIFISRLLHWICLKFHITIFGWLRDMRLRTKIPQFEKTVKSIIAFFTPVFKSFKKLSRLVEPISSHDNFSFSIKCSVEKCKKTKREATT